MKSGDILEVKGDFVEAGENIKRFVKNLGHEITDFQVNCDNYLIKIKKL